jgi:hypothetical protein
LKQIIGFEMTQKPTCQDGSSLPGLMGEYTDEELNEHTIKHAKYFTVVQITRGGFVGGGKNYDRHQVDSLESANQLAADLYRDDPKKRGIIIYAVADFAGANGFSRPVGNYPPTTYMSKSDKARHEKKRKAEAREKLRAARMSLGEGRLVSATKLPSQVVADDQQTSEEAWMNADVPLAFISDDD